MSIRTVLTNYISSYFVNHHKLKCTLLTKTEIVFIRCLIIVKEKVVRNLLDVFTYIVFTNTQIKNIQKMIKSCKKKV